MTPYSEIDAVNYSTLKAIARSPFHYQHALRTGAALDTDAGILGRVTHLATFEPAKVETHVAVWEGRRAGKEWEKFCADNQGKEIIKTDAMAVALQIAISARKAAGKLLSEGESEVVLQWTDEETGLKCKGRLDHISRGYGIIDLKSTADAAPLAFGRRAAALAYVVQAAMYTDGAERCGYGRLPYTILPVESKAPHAATLYTVTEDQLALGRETYRGWLRTVAECRASGQWPSYPPSVLTLPKWVGGPDAESQDVSQWFKEESDG